MNSARLSKIGSIVIAVDSLMEDHWPPNLSDLNPPNKHVWEAMLNTISCKHSQKKIKELNVALELIWNIYQWNLSTRPLYALKRDSEQTHILMVDTLHACCNAL